MDKTISQAHQEAIAELGQYIQSVNTIYTAAEVKCTLPKASLYLSTLLTSVLDKDFPHSRPRVFSMKKGFNSLIDEHSLQIDLNKLGGIKMPIRLKELTDRLDKYFIENPLKPCLEIAEAQESMKSSEISNYLNQIRTKYRANPEMHLSEAQTKIDQLHDRTLKLGQSVYEKCQILNSMESALQEEIRKYEYVWVEYSALQRNFMRSKEGNKISELIAIVESKKVEQANLAERAAQALDFNLYLKLRQEYHRLSLIQDQLNFTT